MRYKREVRQTTTRLVLTQSIDHQAGLADPGRTVRVRKPTRRRAGREGHRVVSAEPKGG